MITLIFSPAFGGKKINNFHFLIEDWYEWRYGIRALPPCRGGRFRLFTKGEKDFSAARPLIGGLKAIKSFFAAAESGEVRKRFSRRRMPPEVPLPPKSRPRADARRIFWRPGPRFAADGPLQIASLCVLRQPGSDAGFIRA